MYELDNALFSISTWISMASLFKKKELLLELLIDINISLTVEKRIRGGIYHAILRYPKANNKYIKYYDKTKELSYIQYFQAKTCMNRKHHKNCRYADLNEKKDMLKFGEDFIKNYDEVYILEVDAELIRAISLYSNCMIKETMLLI